MVRLLWLGPRRVEPEEVLAALSGRRPAPEPIPFYEATPDLLARRMPDAVLVDGREHPGEAAALVRKLRSETEAPFVVVLDPDELKDFDWTCGAADFVTGACTSAELDLRLARITDPHDPDFSDVMKRGELSINRERFEVTLGGDALDLTFKEFELLAYLAARPGKVVSRHTLLSEVWGYDYFGGTRTVDVHVTRVRSKLGGHKSMIETVRNVGYRFSG